MIGVRKRRKIARKGVRNARKRGLSQINTINFKKAFRLLEDLLTAISQQP